MFKQIDVTEAKQLMAEESVQVLDMRDHRSYRASHIEGAVLLHEGLEKQLIIQGEKKEPLLLYCYHGIKSLEKAQFMSDLGFTRVYSLRGGFTAWPR